MSGTWKRSHRQHVVAMLYDDAGVVIGHLTCPIVNGAEATKERVSRRAESMGFPPDRYVAKVWGAVRLDNQEEDDPVVAWAVSG